MKKFLSLVLALVMTMSLVTIGAGATEYKDLTDKGEIQYEEAVAVLNKLGIITGYGDGSFKPTGALTRGAAAKIIVSLMIGSEAAANLTVAAAPYKDVATTNTFAAVISYCKTAGYISGYTDGTFRPTGALTGYAFSKMLLGALGYKADVEGFTGSGWTMNVAKLGNKAGLFNDFATAFSGNAGVTREAACLLALNTLKATEVEYVGNTVSVSGKDISVAVGNNQSTPVDNLSNTDGNIPSASDVNGKDKLMQFAEEHFTDLKLASTSIPDSFGCPANQWTYKSVEIGKYAKTADFTYTTTASGDTATDKVKSMGIKDYTLGGNAAIATNTITPVINGKNGTAVTALTDIPGLLGKGTKVMLYTSSTVANRITDIVVIQTQVMQVKKVNSDNVTLKTVESSGFASAVNTVNDDDNAYATLKGLKADDFVVVTPLWNGSTYDVDSVYVPTTVTGNISKVSLDLTLPVSPSQVTGVTVSGTDYKLSKNWTVKDGKSNLGTSSVSTTVQSTLYLDAYGFMIYATDVTASSDYIIYDETYANTVNGRIHYFAQGYDMNGAALSLDMGTNSLVNNGLVSGDLVKYTTKDAPDNADYKWDGTLATDAVQAPATISDASAADGITSLSAGSYFLDLNCNGTQDAGEITYASDVKFIFLSMNTAGTDVTGVTVKDGAQKISSATNVAYTIKDSKIKVVVVKGDADVEVSANIMYVSEVTGQSQDAAGKNVSVFTGYIDGTETKNLVANKTIATGFYTYAEKDGIYTMNAYSPAMGSSNYVLNSVALAQTSIVAENYIKLLGANNVSLDAHNATVIDLYKADGVSYSSIKDMAGASSSTVFTVAIQYNSSTSTANSGKVAYIYILANTAPAAPAATVTLNTQASGAAFYATKANAVAATSAITTAKTGDTIYVAAANAQKVLTGITGTSVTLVQNPTATDKAVYSLVVTGDIATNSITEADVYKVSAGTLTTTSGGLTFALTTFADQYVAAGAMVDVTVTVSGVATVATPIDLNATGVGAFVTRPTTTSTDVAGMASVTGAANKATFTPTAVGDTVNATYTMKVIVGSADVAVGF